MPSLLAFEVTKHLNIHLVINKQLLELDSIDDHAPNFAPQNHVLTMPFNFMQIHAFLYS